ncbi:hypothetical protein Lepto7376_0035 [[Leptolyngbya] sp. PCC 7376]|uniref:hypothetical protein n=1 Tax=[Leptolyngbya] sp. PCC 7376 TaxID=111781 RepID=UPI00029F24A3|nr:hypothetical protein [[Leptolyngbya] sp. PCC 7376]AFY36495.1 hypothetical protein Lepto7376_0035 [[Leptolyngbya] sp. PCC 7376]
MTWQAVKGVLLKGHQVASGLAKDSPYEAGTIALQTPHFKRLGLDLTPYFAGTLNLSIAPKTFRLRQPSYTFPNLKWHPDFDSETFSFCPCQILVGDRQYDGLIYYPHPETKINHFQDPHTVELIAPPISDIEYGDRLTLKVRPHEVAIE